MAFTFQPPTSVSVIGSFALRTAAKPELVLDVAVQIPDACLFKKAHLNYRCGCGWLGRLAVGCGGWQRQISMATSGSLTLLLATF